MHDLVARHCILFASFHQKLGLCNLLLYHTTTSKLVNYPQLSTYLTATPHSTFSYPSALASFSFHPLFIIIQQWRPGSGASTNKAWVTHFIPQTKDPMSATKQCVVVPPALFSPSVEVVLSAISPSPTGTFNIHDRTGNVHTYQI